MVDMNLKGMEHGIGILLASMGIDYENDDNFKDTPKRVARLYAEMCQGLNSNSHDRLEKILSSTFPISSEEDQLITVENHDCWSLCPHHLLPVQYRVDVGYITGNTVLGLSKLPRMVSLLAQQPILQEDFTNKIVLALEEGVHPKGSIVLVRGEHLCMRARGIKSSNSITKTTALSGIFREDSSTKDEFFRLLELR